MLKKEARQVLPSQRRVITKTFYDIPSKNFIFHINRNFGKEKGKPINVLTQNSVP